jgi:restriction system protein
VPSVDGGIRTSVSGIDGPYTARTAEHMQVALRLVQEAGGQMPLRDILSNLPSKVPLDARDLTTHKTGGVRWSTALQFYAINYEKAGFIARDRGVWSITPEGAASLSWPAIEVFARGREAYSAWRASQGSADPANADSRDAPGVPSASAPPASAEADRIEEEARTALARALWALNPYEFQAFVAAVLRGLGYHVGRTSPKGPDGGTDILAFPDPLGAKIPHVRVQVKHRQSQKATRDELASLRGILLPDREIGSFVSSVGFTNEAIIEASRGRPHIRLIDLDQVLDAYVENYDRLRADDRARLPLRKVYVLAPDEA